MAMMNKPGPMKDQPQPYCSAMAAASDPTMLPEGGRVSQVCT